MALHVIYRDGQTGTVIVRDDSSGVGVILVCHPTDGSGGIVVAPDHETERGKFPWLAVRETFSDVQEPSTLQVDVSALDSPHLFITSRFLEQTSLLLSQGVGEVALNQENAAEWGVLRLSGSE